MLTVEIEIHAEDGRQFCQAVRELAEQRHAILARLEGMKCELWHKCSAGARVRMIRDRPLANTIPVTYWSFGDNAQPVPDPK